ncbi:hypothetical protein XCR_1399 [Xanthomonas campestris pv. raphani 756C]|nr:hypothetical protein XCR_1399 [Xanthomonas campestris pv. raphani 756C]
MLAEYGHEPVEIDACAADLRGVRRLIDGILHDRSSCPWRPRPSSDTPAWVAMRAGKDSRKPRTAHVRAAPAAQAGLLRQQIPALHPSLHRCRAFQARQHTIAKRCKTAGFAGKNCKRHACFVQARCA